MKLDTIKDVLIKQAAIAGLASNLKKSYSGHNLLTTDLQLIEFNADASMKILNDELEKGESNEH